MKVSQLAHFLDSVIQGLDGIAPAPSKEFRAFSIAMKPFAEANVVDFTAFLEGFGAEFQQTGKITEKGKMSINKVAKPPKLDAAQQVAGAVSAIQDLFSEIDRGTVDEARVTQVLGPIGKLTVAQLHEVLAGLKIAERPKVKGKIVDAIKQVIRHQMESRSRAASAGTGGHTHHEAAAHSTAQAAVHEGTPTS